MTLFSNTLQSCFEAFKDEKDEGDLALTPLYLMIGCAAPLWIHPFSFSKYIPLPVLAGLLTVAIGDAMASIGGTHFGSHRWPRKFFKRLKYLCNNIKFNIPYFLLQNPQKLSKALFVVSSLKLSQFLFYFI